jgi:hypothetical protein
MTVTGPFQGMAHAKPCPARTDHYGIENTGRIHVNVSNTRRSNVMRSTSQLAFAPSGQIEPGARIWQVPSPPDAAATAAQLAQLRDMLAKNGALVASDCMDGAGELHQHAITHHLHDAGRGCPAR